MRMNHPTLASLVIRSGDVESTQPPRSGGRYPSMTREKPYLSLVREVTVHRTTSTRAASRERDIADLRALLEEDEVEVRARYDAGRLVVKLTRYRRHGSSALGILAGAVGCGEATLHRCVLLAETWTPRAFDKLVKGTNGAGRPLGFSQLVFLAGIRSRSERTVWCEQARRNGWSVRELKRRWRGREGDAAEPPRFTREVDAFHRGLAACREALAALLDDAEAGTPEAIDDLACALVTLRNVCRELRARLLRLECAGLRGLGLGAEGAGAIELARNPPTAGVGENGVDFLITRVSQVRVHVNDSDHRADERNERNTGIPLIRGSNGP